MKAGAVEGHLQHLTQRLLAERTPEGFWEGELSASSLSTATAVSALAVADPEKSHKLIEAGIGWLVQYQNPDGGWGDTTRSISNISTTLLVRAAFALSGQAGHHRDALKAAETHIQEAGGFEGMIARYGKDRTFSVPILTNCALAGQVDWERVEPLPFEWACLPQRCFDWVRLPVVSYALPALIAIGQVRHFHRPPTNPLRRAVRSLARGKALSVLDSIQPSSGGFLEAVPLTSFVAMSLASIGEGEHPVTRRAVQFLRESARPDGNWPIDANLSAWLTTLSVKALKNCGGITQFLEAEEIRSLRDWLLRQQFRERHPYTNAAPGGWGWTHLPGSVPDADDTPGAMLALHHLGVDERTTEAAALGARWLLGLQNRDGGWPTFCRGRGHLPFDRSGTDLTAHVMTALDVWRPHLPSLAQRIDRAVSRGFSFLDAEQRTEGYWVPLWFGNQFAPDEENPTYGTSRVLAVYRQTGRLESPAGTKARRWILQNQNEDGGWCAVRGTPSSLEETALAVEAIVPPGTEDEDQAVSNALAWMCEAIAAGQVDEPTPIGFYFAKLWYFEKLYPLVFTVAALGRIVKRET